MIHEMVFDPTALRTLGLVFDEAWNCLVTERPKCATRPEMRLRLASVVLHLARDHQLGQEQIKSIALHLLTRNDADLVATG
jgi:hypothetical protein